jgi:hypothetical protein
MKNLLGRFAVAGLIATAVLALPAAAHAQQGFGVRAGYSSDPDQFYFGGHAGVGPLVSHLWFRPNVEIGLGNNVTTIALNAEVAWWFPSKGAWKPYLGAGPALNIYDSDGGSDTEGGVNFLFGVEHRGGFFGEFKVGAFDSPEIKFGIGYTFH